MLPGVVKLKLIAMQKHQTYGDSLLQVIPKPGKNQGTFVPKPATEADLHVGSV